MLTVVALNSLSIIAKFNYYMLPLVQTSHNMNEKSLQLSMHVVWKSLCASEIIFTSRI